MGNEKVIEQFHYFNITADIDSVYDNWAVSTNGDVVNSVFPYAILAIHLKDSDWVKKVRTKIWFKPEYEMSLKKAIDRANEIIKH